MKDQTRVDALKLDPQNPRQRTARGRDLIVASLKDYGAARSIVVDERDVVLAGNGVVDAATEAGITKVRIVEARGDEIIAVRRRGLSAKQKRALAIADNRTGELSEWNAEALKLAKAEGLDLQTFWTAAELATLLPANGTPAADAISLQARFGVPPFSVLDARQGYWQDRKRAWLALGIQSELGRGDTEVKTPHLGKAAASGLVQLRAQQKAARDVTPGGRGENSAWFSSGKRRVSPGGSPRPAMKLRNGRTQRGDGRGRPLT